MNNSAKYSLNTRDWKQVLKSALVWLVPLGLIYIAQIQAILQNNGITIKLEDFIPTTFTWGAIVHYVTNRLYDIGQKFLSTNK